VGKYFVPEGLAVFQKSESFSNFYEISPETRLAQLLSGLNIFWLYGISIAF